MPPKNTKSKSKPKENLTTSELLKKTAGVLLAAGNAKGKEEKKKGKGGKK